MCIIFEPLLGMVHLIAWHSELKSFSCFIVCSRERIAAIYKISYSYILNNRIEILLTITSLPPKYCTMWLGLCCVAEAYDICVLTNRCLINILQFLLHNVMMMCHRTAVWVDTVREKLRCKMVMYLLNTEILVWDFTLCCLVRQQCMCILRKYTSFLTFSYIIQSKCV